MRVRIAFFAAAFLLAMGSMQETPLPTHAQSSGSPASNAALHIPYFDVSNLPDAHVYAGIFDPSSEFAFQDAPQNVWKLAEPFDLSGEVPSAAEVNKNISESVRYILGEQLDNGSWDVKLSGQIFSSVADDVIDPIIATSLSGLALRAHVEVDSRKIERALRKAREYVMDRVIRGRLSTRALYAIWRYDLGLRFLVGEYRAESDEEKRDEIESVCRRLISSILKMQNNNDPSSRPRLERASRVHVSRKGGRHGGLSGVICALPTDKDYKGGALVKRVHKKSSAYKEGLRPGDRILKVRNLRIENAYDFYSAEASFLDGMKRIPFIVRKKGTKADAATERYEISIPVTRPGSLGLMVKQGKEGVIVQRIHPYSPLQEADIGVGTEITKIDSKKVRTPEEFYEVDLGLKHNEKIRITYAHDGEFRDWKFFRTRAGQRMDGWIGFRAEEEDTVDDSGIEVKWIQSKEIASAGIRVGDRITHVNGLEVLGYDHFDSISETFYYGQKVTLKGYHLTEEAKKKAAEKQGAVKSSGKSKFPIGPEYAWTPIRYTREDYKDEFEVTVTLPPLLRPGQLQIEAETRGEGKKREVVITDVYQHGAADEAGLNRRDVVISLNNQRITSHTQLLQDVARRYYAGQLVTLKIERIGVEKELKVQLAESEGLYFNEEGGWGYYPTANGQGFVTAVTILALQEARDTLPLDDIAGAAIFRSLLRASASLRNLRVTDPENDRKSSFVYDVRGKDLPDWCDIRGNMGRTVACSLALYSQDKADPEFVKHTLENFLRYRDELDRVRRFPGSHVYEAHGNAAYYWLFGHYYAAKAANGVSKYLKKRVHEGVLKALMLKHEEEEGWLGHPSFGKLCGTTQALLVLAELKDLYTAESK